MSRAEAAFRFVLTIGGIALVGAGCWQVRPWLSLIVCGALVLWMAGKGPNDDRHDRGIIRQD